MLGFEVAQSIVSKYMLHGPRSQWKTFLRNHAQAIAAVDLCVVPTPSFDRLFSAAGAKPRSAPSAVVHGDAASDSRVAGATDHRGFSLGLSAGLSRARQ